MPARQKIRSEATKQAILSAAGKLFAERGYTVVTMREIAKEAGCSHTAIYLYFKDKEALLHELSAPPLLELKQRLELLQKQSGRPPEARLKEIGMAYIRFCLLHKTMYAVFFLAKGTSVEHTEPEPAVNRLRIELFRLIGQSLKECLPQLDDNRLLAFNRIYFYMLHGIVSSYTHGEEPHEAVMDRLGPTFEEALDSLLAGLKEQWRTEADRL